MPYSVLLPFILLFVVLCCTSPPISATTILHLEESGTLEGELLNHDEINRKVYQIQTPEGLTVWLDIQTVEKVQGRHREAIIKYNRDAPLSPNTIENHLYWARWCFEQHLPDQANIHWQQILELDPNHGDARRVLGYTETLTGWESLRHRNENRGLTQYQGRWRSSYEIEVLKHFEEQTQIRLQWQRTLREYINRLPHSESSLLAIRDPAAVIPIRDMLFDARTAQRNPQIRALLYRALVQIPDMYALQLVAGGVIRPDEPEEIRRLCLEELERQSRNLPEVRAIVISVFRSALRSVTEPSVINLAAEALAGMGGREAVPELIDVLVVSVTETIQTPPQSPSFGPGGSGGIQWGTATARRTIPIPNQTVLSALRRLTNVDFGFEQSGWRDWYREAYRSPAVNLRRSL